MVRVGGSLASSFSLGHTPSRYTNGPFSYEGTPQHVFWFKGRQLVKPTLPDSEGAYFMGVNSGLETLIPGVISEGACPWLLQEPLLQLEGAQQAFNRRVKRQKPLHTRGCLQHSIV